MKSSGDVLFDDAEIKSLNWFIDKSVNEIFELTSVFRISGTIAVGIDAIIFFCLDIKNSSKLFAICFCFHFSGAVLHLDQKAILNYHFPSTHSHCIIYSSLRIFQNTYGNIFIVKFQYRCFRFSVFMLWFLFFLFILKSSSSKDGHWCLVNVFFSGRTESIIFSSNLRYISHASSILEAT